MTSRRVALAIAAWLWIAGARAASPFAVMYAVDGDAQAAPIQAFQNDNLLYVQLRNPAQPPAPIGPSGPMAYVMRGPYMVLPLVSRVTLTYGPYSATVRALDQSALPADVVSLTQPVDAMAVPSIPSPPAAPSPGQVVPTVSARDDHDVVVGDIRVESPTPQSTPPLAATVPTQEQPAPNPKPQPVASAAPRMRGAMAPKKPPAKPQIPQADASAQVDASQWVVSYAKAADPAMWGGRLTVRLVADGTADGASAAISAADACRIAGSHCEIAYTGGTQGVLRIEQINAKDAAP